MCIYSMTAAAAAPWRLSRDQPDLRKDLKTAAWSGCLRACLTPLLASSHPLAYQVFPAAIRGRSLTSRAEVTAWCVLLCEAVLPLRDHFDRLIVTGNVSYCRASVTFIQKSHWPWQADARANDNQ